MPLSPDYETVLSQSGIASRLSDPILVAVNLRWMRYRAILWANHFQNCYLLFPRYNRHLAGFEDNIEELLRFLTPIYVPRFHNNYPGHRTPLPKEAIRG
jgi:hypothetical protein